MPPRAGPFSLGLPCQRLLRSPPRGGSRQPGSRSPSPASHLPSSRISHPASHTSHPTCPHPAPPIPHPTHPTSRIPHLTSYMPHPAPHILHPTSHISHPTSHLPSFHISHPASHIPDPTCSHPTFHIPQPLWEPRVCWGWEGAGPPPYHPWHRALLCPPRLPDPTLVVSVSSQPCNPITDLALQSHSHAGLSPTPGISLDSHGRCTRTLTHMG